MTSPNDPGKPPGPGKAELGKKAADLIAELNRQPAAAAQAVRGASRGSARAAGRRPDRFARWVGGWRLRCRRPTRAGAYPSYPRRTHRGAPRIVIPLNFGG